MYCCESVHVAPLTDSAGESKKCAVQLWELSISIKVAGRSVHFLSLRSYRCLRRIMREMVSCVMPLTLVCKIDALGLVCGTKRWAHTYAHYSWFGQICNLTTNRSFGIALTFAARLLHFRSKRLCNKGFLEPPSCYYFSNLQLSNGPAMDSVPSVLLCYCMYGDDISTSWLITLQKRDRDIT